MQSSIMNAYNRLNQSAIQIGSLKKARQLMNSAFLPHTLNPVGESRNFSLEYRTRNFGRLQFHTVSYAEEMLVRTPPFKSFYCIHFSASGECEYMQHNHRHLVGPTHAYVSGAEHEFEQHMSPNYKQVTLKVDKQTLERFLVSELGKILDKPLSFEAKPIKVSNDALTFLSYAMSYHQLLSNDSFITGQHQVSKHTENAIISMLLNIFPNNYTEEYCTHEKEIKPSYIRRVEKFIADHALDNIDLQDIIDSSGVSRRSLHSGFRHYLNTTPMKYLKLHRLRIAHSMLTGLREENGTVTNIASQCGFTHMSKFSQDYAAVFGECPSETIKKASN